MEYQDLSIFKVPGTFRGKSKIAVQLWWILQETLFAWSPQFLYEWRSFLLWYPWKVKIGDYSWVGESCVLYSLGNITVGSHVAISHRVYVNTGGHEYNKKTFDIFSKPVVIEDECWITHDVYVAPGVTIGKGTIVSARSSVLKDLPAGKVCIGTPAKPIKDRNPSK